MDKQVFILKLINGDEIFGTVAAWMVMVSSRVDNPMSSESRNMSDGS